MYFLLLFPKSSDDKGPLKLLYSLNGSVFPQFSSHSSVFWIHLYNMERTYNKFTYRMFIMINIYFFLISKTHKFSSTVNASTNNAREWVPQCEFKLFCKMLPNF